MKVSTNWLREYIDIGCPLDELADKLTMAGLEVEEIATLAKDELVSHGGEGLSDDTVFDVKATPNRGDWLSMIGVAREAATTIGAEVRLPEPRVEGSAPASSEMVKISVEAPEFCGRYAGVVVRNVKIKDSPGWMKDRLLAAGMRPINNVVDITNYVMLELGQPLHAFDYGLLRGRQVIVRTARPGETIVSIDDTERKLDPDMLVIADADRAVAIAGVMGGADSEVSEQTQDILIESANFNSVSIRRTSKRLGMVTESSYRFERGVDPSITVTAALRAAELMRDLADGEVASGVVDVCPRPVGPVEVKARPERVNRVLGTHIDVEVMAGYLRGFGIDTSVQEGQLVCLVPTFRPDITREIDIVEEIGRGYGYQNLGTTLPEMQISGKDSPEGAFRARVRRVLMSCGAQEVLTHSLVEPGLAGLAGRSERSVRVRNPLSEELSAMRVALIPNLLQVVGRNQAFGTENVSVFEVGKVYFQGSDGHIDETLSVAGAMVGDLWRNSWSLPTEAMRADFYFCKGVVESLLDALGIGPVTFMQTRDPLLHPTRAAKILFRGVELGMLGEAAPNVREALDLRERPCVFELDFRALMKSAPAVLKYRHLPKYPALHRHLAAVVNDDVEYRKVLDIVRESGREIVEGVDLLDVYKGEPIASDQRSLTLSIVFRSRERTLTDEEVNLVLATIRDALASKAGASFR